MTQPPEILPSSPDQPRSRKRLRWPWLAGLAALVFIAGAFVLAFAITSGENTVSGKPAAGSVAPSAEAVVTSTQLRLAYNGCGGAELADGDHTMIIDSEGEELGSGTATIYDAYCILESLDTPQSVIAQMEATRALDGMQTAQWNEFEASWTYHPDAGLDVIITESV